MLKMEILLVIALAPLLGAIVAGLFGRQIGRVGAHTVTILAVAISCVLSITTPQGAKEITITSQSYNGGQMASDANWQLAYTRAFEDFLKKLDAELAAAGL